MNGHILVADDDTAIRTVVSQALSRAGYDVRTTGTAASLWRWVQAGDGDLVITDVVMPDENAFELLPRIKKLRPENYRRYEHRERHCPDEGPTCLVAHLVVSLHCGAAWTAGPCTAASSEQLATSFVSHRFKVFMEVPSRGGCVGGRSLAK